MLRLARRAGRLALVLGLAGAAVWGAKAGLHRFFIENEEFQLSEVDLETNGEFREGHFAALTGLDPTASVFGINLSDLRDRLLARPGIVNAELSRRLPGILRVKVEERIPVAWLECKPLGIVGKDPESGLLLDKDGVCFPCEDWWEKKARTLPVVLVSQAKEGDVTIGKRLRHHEARRALEVVKHAQSRLAGQDWTLPVVAVCNDYSLLGATSTGVLAVFGMYEHDRQMDDLITLMRHTAANGERMSSVNLIPNRNIPVKFSPGGAGQGFVPENRLEREILAILDRN